MGRTLVVERGDLVESKSSKAPGGGEMTFGQLPGRPEHDHEIDLRPPTFALGRFI